MSEQPSGRLDGPDGLGAAELLLRDEAVWAEPPADLFERIAASSMPPVAHRRWGWWVAAAAAAAAAIFLVGFAVGDAGRDEPATVADGGLVAQLQLVGTDLAPSARADVDVFDRGAGYALILDTTGLEPAAAGTYYEGWLRSEAGDEVSVGTFHMRGGDDNVVLWSGVAIDEFPTLVVTRTAVGGGPGEAVMSGTLAA